MKLASNLITDHQDCEYLPTKSFVDTYTGHIDHSTHLNHVTQKTSPSRKIFSSM